MDLGAIDLSTAINILLGLIGWSINRELHHIGKAIEAVSATVTRAQATADKANDRIDQILEDFRTFP